MSFSRSGSCYASTAKLINCLIACLLMLTVAFAAIPYFLVSHTKAKTAAMINTARINKAKMMAIDKNLNPDIAHQARPYVYKTSNGKGKAVISRSGQVVRVKIVRDGEHLASPVSFEARAENKVKRGKPNET
jgi:hypothetical protein